MIKCNIFCRNYSYSCTKGFIIFNLLSKIEYFHFPHSKMAANYAEIGRVAKLEPVLNKFLLYNVSEIFIILL